MKPMAISVTVWQSRSQPLSMQDQSGEQSVEWHDRSVPVRVQYQIRRHGVVDGLLRPAHVQADLEGRNSSISTWPSPSRFLIFIVSLISILNIPKSKPYLSNTTSKLLQNLQDTIQTQRQHSSARVGSNFLVAVINKLIIVAAKLFHRPKSSRPSRTNPPPLNPNPIYSAFESPGDVASTTPELRLLDIEASILTPHRRRSPTSNLTSYLQRLSQLPAPYIPQGLSVMEPYQLCYWQGCLSYVARWGEAPIE